MAGDESAPDPVNRLAEDFLARYRAGERPDSAGIWRSIGCWARCPRPTRCPGTSGSPSAPQSCRGAGRRPPQSRITSNAGRAVRPFESVSFTSTGKLFGETDLLTLAKAYQDATGHHLKRPPEDTWVTEKKDDKKG